MMSDGLQCRRFQRTAGKALALTLLAAASIGCSRGANPAAADARYETPASLTARISNDEVRWDGNYVMLWPELSGYSEEIHATCSKDCIPDLVEALEDQDRYVAAHVLLTIFNGGEYELSAAAWNGLKVQLTADGKTVIPGGQQAALIKQWRAIYPDW